VTSDRTAREIFGFAQRRIPLAGKSSILTSLTSLDSAVTSDAPRTARIVHSIDEIPANVWNACANPGAPIPDNPFLEHGFLRALEKSGSATARTGWQPFHVVLERKGGDVIGVVPILLERRHPQPRTDP